VGSQLAHSLLQAQATQKLTYNQIRTNKIEYDTTLILKSSVFWYITPCRLAKVSWWYGREYLLCLHGWRVS
jgi:hypothetical protein